MLWSGAKNGELLRLIEGAQFQVFLTNDQNLQAQQNLERRPFAILIMTAVNWPIVRPHVAKIIAAVDSATPGTLATGSVEGAGSTRKTVSYTSFVPVYEIPTARRL